MSALLLPRITLRRTAHGIVMEGARIAAEIALDQLSEQRKQITLTQEGYDERTRV